METSLKPGFAQIFSCCPKNLSCPNFGGAAAPLTPPGPYAYECNKVLNVITFCPKGDEVLNVIRIFCPKCNKLLSCKLQ